MKVKLTSGLVIHRHFDQIRKITVDKPPVESVPETDPEAYTYISVNSDGPEAVSRKGPDHLEL